MTPSQFKAARRALGLSITQMADMLDCAPLQVRRMEMHEDRQQWRPVHGATGRLMQAYLEGYRPADWPHPEKGLNRSVDDLRA